MSSPASHDERLAEGVVRALRPRSVLVVGRDVDRLVGCLEHKGVAAGSVQPAVNRGGAVPATSVSLGQGSNVDLVEEGCDLVLWIDGGCPPDTGALKESVERLTSAAGSVLFGAPGIEGDTRERSGCPSAATWLETFSTNGFEADLSFDTTFAGPHFLLLKKDGAKHTPETRTLLCELLHGRTLALHQQQLITCLSKEIDRLKVDAALSSDRLRATQRIVAILDNRVGANAVQIEALYTSRIWKLLQVAASWALRVGQVFGPGRGSGAGPGPELRLPAGDPAESKREEYARWILLNEPSDQQKEALAIETQGFPYKPRISIVIAIGRTGPRFLSHTMSSLRAQRYQHWELIVAHDDSLEEEAKQQVQVAQHEDRRVRVLSLDGQADVAHLANAALRECNGDFVGFVKAEDELGDLALVEVVHELNSEPRPDVLYGDEDKLDEAGRRTAWNFKPGWSPDLLRSFDYVGCFVVARRALVDETGGWRAGVGGAYVYDLLLRLSEKTKRIQRIPAVLYHSRLNSTEESSTGVEGVKEAERKALREHLDRTQYEAQIVKVGSSGFRVRYQVTGPPAVTGILLTGGRMDLLSAALEGLRGRTSYGSFGIVVVDNSRDAAVKEFVHSLESGRVAVEYCDARSVPFNCSRLYNLSAEGIESPLLVFLNDDIGVIGDEWLTAMVEHGQRDEVGVVGARLLFADGKIQHAGVVMGLCDGSGHAFRGTNPAGDADLRLTGVIRNTSSVTGACMLIRKAVFQELGGFEDQLPSTFQDIDLCLKALEHGYLVVYTPYAELYHYEGSTKTAAQSRPSARELAYMQERWKSYIEDDPYYNPNLTRDATDYGLRFGPRTGCRHRGTQSA